MQSWEVILQDAYPCAATCVSALGLERLAASLPRADNCKTDKAMFITKKGDVMKAIQIWRSCLDRLSAAFQDDTGLGVPSVSTYIRVICELPQLMPSPHKTSSRAVLDVFCQAITSGVTTCVNLVKESQNLTGSKLQYVSEVAEVIRTFAEDFCDLWKADLGAVLIPQLLDIIVELNPAPGLSYTSSVAEAMHRTGAISFCSGLLCYLVTRCQANQKVVQHHERFNEFMRDVLPAISALDVQLEMLEVLFRVYRSSRTAANGPPMTVSQFEDTGLTCVKGKLDSLVAAKSQKLNLTKRLVDISVSFNSDQANRHSLCCPKFLMDPITVLPVKRAQLKSKDTVTAISKTLDIIAFSRSSISIMMNYQLDDGAQDDWLVIPTATLMDLCVSAAPCSKLNWVELAATIPRAFHRNTAAEELFGHKEEDQFDIILCMEMTPSATCKLKGIIQPLLNRQCHRNCDDRENSQKDADIAPISARPSAAAECADHRRLSITTLPVFQPLKFQPLRMSDQAKFPVGLKNEGGHAAIEEPVQQVTPPCGVATGDRGDTEAVHEGATNNGTAPANCDTIIAAGGKHGNKDTIRQRIARKSSSAARAATGHGSCIAASKFAQTLPSRSRQEPIFARRRRHQQAEHTAAIQSMDQHGTGLEGMEINEGEKSSAVRLRQTKQEWVPSKNCHTGMYCDVLPSAKEVVPIKAKASSIGRKKVTPTGKQYAEEQRKHDQMDNIRTGRPKRRAAQRKVDYNEGVDNSSADEVPDPVSETTLPIPHAQASKKKVTETIQALTVKELNYCRGDRSRRCTPSAPDLPDRKQIENSGMHTNIDRVISETQSDHLEPSKSCPKRSDRQASCHERDEFKLDQTRLINLGDKVGPAWLPFSKQQARHKDPIDTGGSKGFPTGCERVPPVHGNAVVPSPLTLQNPLGSGCNAHLVPSTQLFQLDRQEQLQIPALAGSICPADPFCSFPQDMTKGQIKFPSKIESSIQHYRDQAAANVRSCVGGRESGGLRPQSHKDRAHQCSTLLQRERSAAKQAKDVTIIPGAAVAGNSLHLSKRRRNAVDSHEDDASQQAQEQQVMVMRMMNAMMQNEDDDDDQNMLQLQAAMSKLIKTKEQRKKQQHNKAIHSSRQRLEDMLSNAVQQFAQEEAQLEQSIGSKLADSTQRMSDLWSVMRDMHSQHLTSLASKWQQYQTLGNKLSEDNQHSLQKMAELKARWSSTLTSLTREAEAEMQQLEAEIFKAKKRSRRQDPASMQKLLSALMQ